jgi:membrane-associated phospholipid phosphatase
MDFPLGLFSGYYPGYLNQDLITLPVEAALVHGISLVSMKDRKPLWPFNSEAASFPTRERTRHSKTVLMPAALGLGVITMASLESSNESFPVWLSLRGLTHAHLINEMFTSLAKVTFARKRPFYDGVKERGETLREDDLKSFFSGHSSHAFTFAAYSSAMLFRYSLNKPLTYTFTSIFVAGASLIAGARYKDGQHNLSDVIVGALVGTATGLFYEYKASEVYGLLQKQEAQEKSVSNIFSGFTVFPSANKVLGGFAPALNLSVVF